MFSFLGLYPPIRSHLLLRKLSSIKIPSTSLGSLTDFSSLQGMPSLVYIIKPPHCEFLSALKGEREREIFIYHASIWYITEESLFRSSASARELPSPQGYYYQFKCVVCGKKQLNGIKEKSRICESNRVQLFREAASFQLDDVYTRIFDLHNDSSIFGADLYYHHSCLAAYIQKYKRSINSNQRENVMTITKRDVFNRHIKFIKDIIDQGSGISLSDIRDMINDLEDININNSEVNNFLIESMGEEIQFCPSTCSNESLFVISSEINIQDVVKILRSIDATKLVAKKIRKCLLAIDLGLNERFCDAEDLKESWEKH